MPGEFEDASGQRQRRLIPRHAGEALSHADAGRQILAVHFVQQRLVIEQIVLRRAAAHEQIDNAFALARESGAGRIPANGSGEAGGMVAAA